MSLQKSHDEFVSDLFKINPNIIVIGQYTTSKSKIDVKCKVCGKEWSPRASSILDGTGCPYCAKRIVSAKNTKSHEQFEASIKGISPNLTLLGKYENVFKKIEVKCNDCGRIWFAIPNNLNRGMNCAVCAAKRHSKTKEEFSKELKEVNPNITLLDDYKGNNKEKVKVECDICKHQWSATPNSLLKGHGCRKCYDKSVTERLTKTYAEFKYELQKIDPTIEIIGEYKKSNIPIECKCLNCGKLWSARPNDLLRGHGCPDCSSSKGEKKIREYFEKNKIDFYSQHKFDDLVGTGGRKLSYDFYIPNCKTLIEFQGLQHYMAIDYFGGDSHFKNQQIHDKLKSDYALSHGYTLIEIPYTEMKNIETILSDNLKIA